MAKIKQQVNECSLCVHSVMIDNKLNCKTKMKDDNKSSGYSLVLVSMDCSFYKEKR